MISGNNVADNLTTKPTVFVFAYHNKSKVKNVKETQQSNQLRLSLLPISKEKIQSDVREDGNTAL